MPDGVLKWFDSKTGEAEIARGGRIFRSHAHDIEPQARRAGARVHFDVQRVHGVEEAVGVELREGTRVSHHHHRFGTLVGARSFDTKGPAAYGQVHPELRPEACHPLEVARSWADSVALGDVPGALSLYSPDAIVNLEQGSVTGPRAIRGWLETTPVLGCARHARVHGSDEAAVICWGGSSESPTDFVVHCRIAHSEIVEQRISTRETEVVAPKGPTEAFDVAVSTKGEVAGSAKDRARDEIGRLLDKLSEPVLFVRIKLAFEPDPARPRPAMAQVTLDVDGDLVRAQVAAHSVTEAVDLLVVRLKDQLEHRARRREHLHRTSASREPGEWRSHDMPTRRPGHFQRPPEERQLVRHKMFVVEELIPDEAVFDMEQLDYDFYLFRDLASGIDSMIERLEDGSYRLSRLHPSEARVGPGVVALETSDVPAPVLTLEDAVERLEVSNESHVFFADATTGRANVVYLRYDGHYGLITPD